MRRLLPTLLCVLVACGGAEQPDSAMARGPSPAQRLPSQAGEGPAELQHFEVDVGGHPLSVWHKTPAEPTHTIVLLHGRTWSSLPDFDLQVEGHELSLMDAFVSRGFRVVAIDQRGYGRTPRDESGWLTPSKARSDTFEVLRFLDAQELIAPGGLYILGWSYGSMLTHLVAQAPPVPLSGIILYAFPRPVGHKSAPQEQPGEPEQRPTTEEGAREDFLIEAARIPAAVDAFAEAALRADPARVDWKDLHEWNELDPSKIHVPTLVIHGDQDPYAPVTEQARLASTLATTDRQWVILPESDHAAHLERAHERFVAAISAFVRREAQH